MLAENACSLETARRMSTSLLVVLSSSSPVSPAAPGGTQPGLSWPTPGELDAAARHVAHAVRTRRGRAD